MGQRLEKCFIFFKINISGTKISHSYKSLIKRFSDYFNDCLNCNFYCHCLSYKHMTKFSLRYSCGIYALTCK